MRSVEAAGMVLRTASNREALVPWQALRDRVRAESSSRRETCSRSTAGRGPPPRNACWHCLPVSGAMDAARFYVAMTRHRSMSWVVLGEGAERRAVAARRPLGDARADQARGHLSHAGAAFARQPRSETATEMMEKAYAARRGAENVFRAILVRIEARRARGKNPTVLPGHSRLRALARVLPRLEERIRARVLVLADLAARVAVIGSRIRRAADVERARSAPEIPQRHRRGHRPLALMRSGARSAVRGERRPSRDAGPLLVVLVDEACPGRFARHQTHVDHETGRGTSSTAPGRP